MGSHGYTADKAVDGNFNSNCMEKSCTHTNEEFQPWWTVDLGAEYLVSEVVITNRGDCCGDISCDVFLNFDLKNQLTFTGKLRETFFKLTSACQ